jgi:hypothetical protein
MTMIINDNMINGGADIFYDAGFRASLEAHMEYFRKSGKSRVVDVPSNLAVIYEGDFFGYLLRAGIALQYHWIIMRVNKMTSTDQFGVNTHTLIVPDQTQIETIRQAYASTNIVTA